MRRAILEELDLPEAALKVVQRQAFDSPLGNWPSRIVASGTVDGSPDAFLATAERIEMSVGSTVASFDETFFDPDAAVRKGRLTFTIQGNALEFPPGVGVQITKTETFSPQPWTDEASTPLAPEVVNVTLNGEDITESVLKREPTTGS